MPVEESKPTETPVDPADGQFKGKQVAMETGSEGEEEEEEEEGMDERQAIGTGENNVAEPSLLASTSSQKKKSKKKKSKKTTDSAKEESKLDSEDFSRTLERLLSDSPPQALMAMLSMKPDLARDVLESADPMATLKSEGVGKYPDVNKVMELMKDFSIEEAMAGLASTGKNRKEMDKYRFWKTQPVPKFDEKEKSSEDGPLEEVSIDQIAKEPEKLRMSAYEWVTMDLTDDAEIKEVYELLNGHYVEDDEAMFRFNYGPGILKWAMMAPGWQKRYHVGVRVVQSRKLVAFISAVPVNVRVRDKVFRSSEVNFLCIHKKLRGLRLAPALIREITRVSNLDGIWQGLFTAGIVLPKPISTCRYFHRPLDWQKLYECNFVHLPPNSKAAYQIRKYSLPERTATKGLREMRTDDMDAVVSLMHRYLERFDIAPMMTREEAQHWFIPPKAGDKDQFIWSYVVEEPGSKQITDFFSFYCIESSAINNPRHSVIRVAYLFYYATEIGLMKQFDRLLLQARLNSLINDALIVAKGAKFDVFNALSLMDNALFLENQKFGAGDGQLHYYLFNYKAKPIAGGVDKLNKLDEANLSGVGFVLP